MRPGVWLGPDFIADELTRRGTDRVSRRLLQLTWVTVVVTRLTLVVATAALVVS